MKAIMNGVATAPSAKAIDMPANIATSVAAPYRSPIDNVLIRPCSGAKNLQARKLCSRNLDHQARR